MAMTKHRKALKKRRKLKIDFYRTNDRYQNIATVVNASLNPEGNLNMTAALSEAERLKRVKEFLEDVKAGRQPRHARWAYMTSYGTIMAEIELNLIDVDRELQRTDDKDIDKLVGIYDPKHAGTLNVSSRSDRLLARNGLHRGVGACSRGYQYVNVEITLNATEEDDAKYFLHQNDNVVTIKPMQNYTIGIAGNEPLANALKEVADAHNLEINTSGNGQTLTGIKEAFKVLKDHILYDDNGDIVYDCYGQVQYDPAPIHWTAKVVKAAGWFNSKKSTLTAHTITSFSAVYDHGVQNDALESYERNLHDLLSKTNYEDLHQYAALYPAEKGSEVRSRFTEMLTDVATGDVSAKTILGCIDTTKELMEQASRNR